MTSANLDTSLKLVPAGQHGNYFLYADGTVSKPSWIGAWFWSLISRFYDPTAENILKVFIQCVDQWIALKNEQKYQLRTVTNEEFSQQVERICFVHQFILAYLPKIQVSPSIETKICGLLSQALPDHTICLPQTLHHVQPQAFLNQLEVVTEWRREENSLSALTPEILQTPPPRIEILDSPEDHPPITELPTFYQSFMQRMDNPKHRWITVLKNWLKGTYKTEQKALKKMCSTILEKTDPAQKFVYASTKLYLGRLLSLFKTGQVSDAQVRICLQNLVLAAGKCAGDWATEAERHHLKLTGKEATPRDKALQWKSQFIDQHLQLFFPTVYERCENAENVHLMNTLLFHYGDQLEGKLDASMVDIHVIQNPNLLPYQWSDVSRHLSEAWENDAVESFKTYSQLQNWQTAIGEFLATYVEKNIPGVKDPLEFVLDEYFDEGILNNRGAIRFLKETLPPSRED